MYNHSQGFFNYATKVILEIKFLGQQMVLETKYIMYNGSSAYEISELQTDIKYVPSSNYLGYPLRSSADPQPSIRSASDNLSQIINLLPVFANAELRRPIVRLSRALISDSSHH